VAAAQDVAPAAVLPLHYFGRDLVLFRSESGHPYLLDAHCPHLGAHLGHGGRVRGETIECPFHNWRIAGNGSCSAIPYATQIPQHATIKSWPIHEVNGQIMAWHSAAGTLPDWQLPEYPECNSPEWMPFATGNRWRIRSHVQEMGENGMDSAHFSILHSQQTERMQTEAVEIDGPILVHRTFQYYAVFGLAKLLVDEVRGPLDITLFGLGCAVNRARVDAKIQLHYTLVFYFTPIDDEHIEVCFQLTMRRLRFPFANAILMRKAIKEGAHTIDQDVPIWETKRFRDRPALCDGDGPIVRFRRWAAQFYAEEPASQTLGLRA
jgi:phenylpropionate dioxygenase-like ring-hydroxylating dioxygenase large terminal subunit